MRAQRLAFAVLMAGLAPACAATEVPPDCGHQGVRVTYTQEADLAAACRGLRDVLAYFRGIGFEFEPRFALTFAHPEKEPIEGVVGYGYADLRSSVIVLNSSSSRQPWGLPWNRQVAGSFLRHELAHIAVWQILGRREAERLRHEWHEFIAYAIQLHLMQPELLRKVLVNFQDVHAFTALSEVNEFIYGMNPDVFAVAAYLTYRERGAEDFVRRLLRGEITPPAPSFPFPVVPEQSLKRQPATSTRRRSRARACSCPRNPGPRSTPAPSTATARSRCKAPRPPTTPRSRASSAWWRTSVLACRQGELRGADLRRLRHPVGRDRGRRRRIAAGGGQRLLSPPWSAHRADDIDAIVATRMTHGH